MLLFDLNPSTRVTMLQQGSTSVSAKPALHPSSTSILVEFSKTQVLTLQSQTKFCFKQPSGSNFFFIQVDGADLADTDELGSTVRPMTQNK